MIEIWYGIRCDQCGESLFYRRPEGDWRVLDDSPAAIADTADIDFGWQTDAGGMHALCLRCRPSQSNERESRIG